MNRFVIVTNTIRRPLTLVSTSITSSLSQNDSALVILIDQNEVPLQFEDSIKNNPRFQHQFEKVPSVSMARNRTRYPMDTEWIIFCDDDGYLDAGYLKKLSLLIEACPEVDVFAGAIKRIDNQDYYSKRHALGGNMKWFWNAKLLMGSNFAIRRSVFEQIGKFDERFGAGALWGSSEETDLAWNVFFNGNRMRYSPELVVFHVPPYSSEIHQEIQKAYRYGVGKGALVKKWLLKGHIIVFLELLEMLALPFIKMPLLLILGKLDAFRIQFSTFKGRVKGLLI